MADSNLNVNIGGRDDLTPILNNLESRIIRFVGAVSSAMATIKVAAFPVTATADFERELANVRKTTDFTDASMAKLADSLKDLSLRMNVSVVDLTKIAAAAGQQGLGGAGAEGIAKFTESVARMASVLDVTAEDAASNVGKLLNIFHLGVNDTEKIASAFNEVSNNSTASGAQLLDIVRRIGDAAGTVDLKKSLGLAATGIDLGLSPEVVGTSFQSIFIQMRSKASQFAKLLGVDVKTWMNTLKGDGIEALTQYLTALRKLRSEDQAKAINTLSGQGRIAGLMNKLVQDTSNSVLNKNLGNAAVGYDGGMSAIKEQQKVLATFNEQAKILKNSVFVLANETGNVLLPQLTSYVAQLSAALQNDAFKSFLQAVGKSMLDVVQSIADGIKWVAQWNVNWENFITIAKVYLGLRLGEALVTIASRLPVISTLLGQVSASAAAMGGAMGRATNESVSGLTRMVTAVREYTAARVQQAAAEEAASRAARVAQSREADYLRQMGQETAAARAARAAQTNVDAARTNTSTVRAQASASVTSVVDTLRNKREQAVQASEARIAQIEAAYRGQRRVAQIAARDAEIAAEETALARRLRGFDSYYSRQLAAARANRTQSIADALDTEQRLTVIQEQAQARRLALANQGNVARSQMEGATDAARVARATAESAAQSTNQAGRALLSFGTIAGALGAILSKAVGFLSGFFFWFSAIYLVLDATGVLEKVPGFFQRIGDSLGLTSEKARKAAEEQKKLTDEMDKAKVAAEGLKKAYDDLKDSNTGGLSAPKVKALKENLQSSNFEQRQRALGTVGDMLEAANNDVNSTSKPAASAYTEQMKTLRVDIDAAVKRYNDLKEAFRNNTQFEGARVYSGQVNDAKEAVNKLTKQYGEAAAAAEAFAQKSKTVGKEVAEQARSNQQEIEQVVSGLFTDKSAKLFQQFVVPLTKANAALTEMRNKQSDLLQAQVTLKDKAGTPKGDEEIAATNTAIDEMRLKIEKAANALAALQKDYTTAMATILAEKDTSQADINSLFGLRGYANQTPKQVDTTNAALKKQQQAGVQLTGELNAKVDDTKPDGDGTFKPNTESEARKMAKVEYELKKAQYDAQAALAKEHNDQVAKIEQTAYDKGLLSMQQYFAERKRLQLDSNNADIKALQLEVGEAARQRNARASDPDAKPSELKSFDVTIARLNGQIAVLQAKRAGITAEADDALQKAVEAFDAQVNSAQLNLMQASGVTDFDLYFARALDAGVEQYKEFWSKLITEGGEQGRELVDQMQNSIKLDALSKVFDQVDASLSRSYSKLDLWLERLALLEQKGIITSAQYEAQAQRYREKIAEDIQSSIDADTNALRTLTNAGDTASQQYRDLAQRLDEAKLKLAQLQATSNQVAASIQQSLANGVTQGLTTLTSGREMKQLSSIQQQVLSDNDASVRRLQDNLAFLRRARSGLISGYQGDQANLDAQIAKTRDEINSLQKQSQGIRNDTRESVLDLVKRSASQVAVSLAKGIQEQAIKNLSQKAMKALGGADGGIGGAVAGLLGQGEPGSSPTNPLYVKDAKEGAADNPLDKAKDQLSEMYDKAKEKVSDVFSSITDSLSDLFSSLSDSLSDIFSSIGDSLSSMFSGGGGDGVGGFIASLFHSGGVVGMTSTPRMAHAGMFAHATRYHTGGIAGLAPNEVPAILQKGEEVLTANDPRHSNNGGGAGGSTSVTVNVDASGNSSVSGDQADAKELGKRIASAVQQQLVIEKRPGGLLSNG